MKKLSHLEGYQLATLLCELNDVKTPDLRVWAREEWRVSTCAYYRASVIHINPRRCAPHGYAGACWSWPGYVTDRTPYGVVLHELGHHFDVMKSSRTDRYRGNFSIELRAASGEEPLTGYCPNDGEWFAEMFRLFCTNPDLLRLVRPRSFQSILDAGLKPAEVRPWVEILEGAPGRTVRAAENRIRGARESKRAGGGAVE